MRVCVCACVPFQPPPHCFFFRLANNRQEKGGRARSCALMALAKALKSPTHRFGVSSFAKDLVQAIHHAVEKPEAPIEQDGNLLLDVARAAWSCSPTAATHIISLLIDLIMGFPKGLISYRHSMRVRKEPARYTCDPLAHTCCFILCLRTDPSPPRHALLRSSPSPCFTGCPACQRSGGGC